MDATKILIVDDEPDILEFLKYNLQKEGFQVIVASDGEEGIAAAERERPDLIILDIMMPKLDGVEVCRQLRSRPEFDKTLIAFLTAREEDYSQIAALENGGDDYITKPIRPRVLISRIRALLRRSDRQETEEEEEGSKFRIGDLVVDKARVSVVGMVAALRPLSMPPVPMRRHRCRKQLKTQRVSNASRHSLPSGTGATLMNGGPRIIAPAPILAGTQTGALSGAWRMANARGYSRIVCVPWQLSAKIPTIRSDLS